MKIVTFCSSDYIPVALNWLQSIEKVGPDADLVIVCLDDETRRAFPADIVLCRPLQVDGTDLSALWIHRIKVLQEMLQAGEAIVHSDADAVWLRDPLADIQACGDPIVFSQGTVWPPDVHARLGLVLCCGFFFLRPEPAVLRFLQAVAARCEQDGDDQAAVNRVMAGWITSWQIEQPYRIGFRDTSYVASRSPMRARGTDLQGEAFTLSVLPHHAYPRLVDAVTDETVVAHPLTGKTLQEKEIELGRLGMWYL